MMRKVTVVAAVLALAGATIPGISTGPAVAAAQAKSSKSTSSDLDQLLAPVALYPDTLLAQILLCAGDPPQVVKLNSWLAENTDVKGTALQDAATVDGFDPSFVALALFPQVVKYMADRGDWTTKLGKAFASNKTGVFDSIQRLRKQAEASGALKDSPQQNVETKTTSSGDVIIIEPANPQIIYVPQYNPQVVYTQPPTQTVVVQEDDDSDAAVAGLIGFTAGIALGAAIDNDYYYGPYGWHGGAYMYNDAWDDYYDAREDAREDWMDHREDLQKDRTERSGNRQEQRTERTEARNTPEAQAQRTERQQTRQENGTSAQAAQARSSSTSGASAREARGQSSGSSQVTSARSGSGKSDAFGGYSSGGSARAASSRGTASRGASRGGGGRRR